jgi:hypothetical protein
MTLAGFVLGLGGLAVALVIAIPIVFIALAVYAVWQLRKPEGWEEK